ncbi:MAG: sugar transferase (PEP-CTERM/EpsH1 system associated) [Halioglobus sp.]|jgi:sugar transferase (PEP-CTERM/EpsH1 system associated)
MPSGLTFEEAASEHGTPAEAVSPLIAHIIYALGTGGLENGLVNIINRMPAHRYRHAIICLTDADDFASRITIQGVQVVQLHKKPGHDIRVYWCLWKTLRSLRPAIVHSRNLAALEMQAIAFFLPGVKCVHGEHGRDMHDLDGSNRKYNLLRKVLQPLIHRYIAVSKDLSCWLEAVVGIRSDKIQHIYNGVDTDRFFPVNQKNDKLAIPNFLDEDSIVIGAVGRLAEVKNQRCLIQAVDLILKAHPELAGSLKVILVGDGPMSNELHQLVETLALSNAIWLPGDRQDIPELLQLMDIFVLPSLAEGISNTVLEAMATGLPIVATNVGGNPELVEEGHNGLLVEVDDPQQLADALYLLLSDQNLRKKMGGNSLEKVRKVFNWENTVSGYMSVYDNALKLSSD